MGKITLNDCFKYILFRKKEKLIHNIRKTIDSLKEMRFNLNKY